MVPNEKTKRKEFESNKNVNIDNEKIKTIHVVKISQTMIRPLLADPQLSDNKASYKKMMHRFPQ